MEEERIREYRDRIDEIINRTKDIFILEQIFLYAENMTKEG